jgi:hypothetical protein
MPLFIATEYYYIKQGESNLVLPLLKRWGRFLRGYL